MTDELIFRKFVDELKDKADLVEVIQTVTPEYQFEKRGKYEICKKPDSLMVDPNWQQYTWFAHAGSGGHEWETGDVFEWLMKYGGCADFWAACVWLADRYSVPVPRQTRERSAEEIKAYKAKFELLEVAQAWFANKLLLTPAALDYCRRTKNGRAFADESICRLATAAQVLNTKLPWTWSPETIERAQAIPNEQRESAIIVRGAGLGFSGGTPEAGEDLKKTFGMYGLDPQAPEAVALCGLRSGVKAWCDRHQVQPQENWLKNDRIYGMTDFPRLIYPHFYHNKVRYFSGRGLAWDNTLLISDPDERHKSYNPPEVLFGPRQIYTNWLFSKNGDLIIIVEGPADAISLAELGFPAIALCGLATDQALAELVREIKHKYVALDNDTAGQAAMFSVGQVFGPMARLVQWESNETDDLIFEQGNEAEEDEA